jgi:hypothetical protein
MLFSELVPTVRELPRADNLRLMQLLVVELAREDDVPVLSADAEYPIYTPLHAYDAGDALLVMLEQHRVKA